MVHYPQEFPGDAARTIVANWRAGTIGAKAAETAECAWNLAGYAMQASLGETQTDPAPTAKIAMQQSIPPDCNLSSGPPINDEEMISTLEAHDQLPADKKLAAGLPIDLPTLLKWSLSLALKILAGVVG